MIALPSTTSWANASQWYTRQCHKYFLMHYTHMYIVHVHLQLVYQHKQAAQSLLIWLSGPFLPIRAWIQWNGPSSWSAYLSHLILIPTSMYIECLWSLAFAHTHIHVVLVSSAKTKSEEQSSSLLETATTPKWWYQLTNKCGLSSLQI